MTIKMSQTEWNRFAVESDYRVEKLAELLRLSQRQLERIIRRDFDSTPHVWLSHRRLIEAGDLLLAGRKVNKVATDLRYKQPSHFCRQFKEFYGVRPSQFVVAKRKATDVAFR